MSASSVSGVSSFSASPSSLLASVTPPAVLLLPFEPSYLPPPGGRLDACLEGNVGIRRPDPAPGGSLFLSGRSAESGGDGGHGNPPVVGGGVAGAAVSPLIQPTASSRQRQFTSVPSAGSGRMGGASSHTTPPSLASPAGATPFGHGLSAFTPFALAPPTPDDLPPLWTTTTTAAPNSSTSASSQAVLTGPLSSMRSTTAPMGSLDASPRRTVQQYTMDLITLALPLTFVTAAQFSFATVNLAFVGQLGNVDELAGAALGIMMVNSTAFSIATGLCGALDTVLSQIYGRDPTDKLFGVQTQRMFFILMLVSIPIALLWSFSDVVLTLFGIDVKVVPHATAFTRRMLLGLVPIMLLEVVKRFCQAQRITFPLTVAVVLGAVANPLMLYFFMVSCGLGVTGSPLAWSLVLASMCLGVIAYLHGSGKAASTWRPFSRLALRGYSQLVPLAVASLMIVLAEWTAFEVNGMIAGKAGAVDLAAYSITLQAITLAWTVYNGFTNAITVCVGNAIGKGASADALAFARVGAGCVLVLAFAQGIAIATAGSWIAAPFTDDLRVLDRVGELRWVTCAYILTDATVSSLNAVLRGLGRQRLAAFTAPAALLTIGMPIGLVNVLHFHRGVEWLLIGPALGMLVSIAVYTTYLAFFVSWDDVTVEAQLAMGQSGAANLTAEISFSDPGVEPVRTLDGRRGAHGLSNHHHHHHCDVVAAAEMSARNGSMALASTDGSRPPR